MHARLVEPLRQRDEAAGADRPQLRAELAAAAFEGVVLGRGSDSFEELAKAPTAELVELVQEMLGVMGNSSP